jgi:hypothetical protein
MAGIAAATYHFTSRAPDANFAWFATARVFQMMALPILFLTITSCSYVRLPPDKSGQGLFHQRRQESGRQHRGVDGADLTHTNENNSINHDWPLMAGALRQHSAVAWIGRTLANQTAYSLLHRCIRGLRDLGLLAAPSRIAAEARPSARPLNKAWWHFGERDVAGLLVKGGKPPTAS